MIITKDNKDLSFYDFGSLWIVLKNRAILAVGVVVPGTVLVSKVGEDNDTISLSRESLTSQ